VTDEVGAPEALVSLPVARPTLARPALRNDPEQPFPYYSSKGMATLSVRRRPLSDEERADRATLERIRRGNRSDARRNWKSQVLLALAFCGSLVAGTLGAGGFVYQGLGLAVVCVPATVALVVWCLRNWDY